MNYKEHASILPIQITNSTRKKTTTELKYRYNCNKVQTFTCGGRNLAL